MSSRPALGVLWTRVEIYFVGPFQKEWSNIYWFQQSAAVGAANYESAAAAIYGQLAANHSNCMVTTATIEGAYISFNDGAGTYGVPVYAATPGTIAGNALPEDVSAVVQRLTATPGPDGRGRIFVAGLPESFSNGSYLNAAGLAALSAFALVLATGVTVGAVTFNPMFFSPKTDLLLAIILWNEIELLATNRRRRPRF